MAAVRGHPVEGAPPPPPFEHMVQTLRSAPVRQGVELSPIRAPRHLAPYAYAVTGSVLVDDEEVADGRLVVLHDPEKHQAWQGTFRVVTLTCAELEQDIAADALLPDVGWSWLIGALDAHGARYCEPSGTVSRCSSHYFGGLSERPVSTKIEIRASWTALDSAGGDSPGSDIQAHLAAWCDLLCISGGLPPAPSSERMEPDSAGGVVLMPNRRVGHRH